MARRILIPLIAALAAALVPSAHAAGLPDAAVPDHVVVRYEPSATPAQRHAVQQAAGMRRMQHVGHRNRHLYEVGHATARLIARLAAMPGVRYAEPDLVTSAEGGPSNDGFGTQWHLQNTGQTGGIAGIDLDARRAWDLVPSGGSPSVLVGWADSGIETDHPGLAGVRLWQNPRPPDGIDQDKDGCVDGPNGCDTVTGGVHLEDENGHGTSTAGMVFANWTSSPIAGLAPNAMLIGAKVLDLNARGTTAQLASGLHFLAARGARVVNVSISGGYSAAVHEELLSHPDTLFVAAAGNAGADISGAPTYPCADPAPNVICVTASNAIGGLASFSNTGAAAVDIAAPGAYVPSLAIGDGYGQFSGTSYAAPLVTGIAALAFTAKPSATVQEVKWMILAGADAESTMAGKVATGGRANAYVTLAKLLGVPAQPRNGVTVPDAAGVGAAGVAPPPAVAAAKVAKPAVIAADDPGAHRTTSTKFTATARRRGRSIRLVVTCNVALCRDRITITGATKKVKRTLKLGEGRRVTIAVAAKAKVRRLRVTSATTRLAVEVR